MKTILIYLLSLFLLIVGGVVLILSGSIQDVDTKSFVIGAISSAIVVVLVEFIKSLRLYFKLAFLQGKWYEYCPSDQDQSKYVFTGLASIHYGSGNLLAITLETLNNSPKFIPGNSYNVGSSWSGTIHINEGQLSSGRISYSYSSQFPYVTEFGYKEITIEKSEKVPGDYFILMTEHSLTGEAKFKVSILKRKFEKVEWN